LNNFYKTLNKISPYNFLIYPSAKP